MRIILKLFLLCNYIVLFAQNRAPDPSYFISPVDHKMVLAGSFGELRTTHFHAGIDIKPRSKNSIDSIRCVAEGKISRIKVQTGGYGKALYIDHPNGYTTVYAHLKNFSPEVEKYVNSIQKSTQSYSVDIYPEKTEFTYDQAEVVGLMGNTGRSFAKHLHFEIRETKSEIPVNPFLWGVKPIDTRPPDIFSLDIQSLDPQYQMVFQKTYNPIASGRNTFTVGNGQVKFPAWRCGVAIQSFDKMNGANNNNGVYAHKMYVDDTLYYSYSMDAVSFAETKYINSHIDYPTRKNQNRTSIRCYKLPDNPLSIYDSIRNDGIFKIFEKQPRIVRIELSDIEDNLSVMEFKIFRDGEMTAKGVSSYNLFLTPESADTIHNGNASMLIRKGALDRPYPITYGVNHSSEIYPAYTFGNENLVFFKQAQVSISLPDTLTGQKKWVVVKKTKKEWVPLSTAIVNSRAIAYTKFGGVFSLRKDTTPPVIRWRSQTKNHRRGTTISAVMNDPFGTELSYRVLLDGEWIIAPYKEMTRFLTIPLSEDLSPGLHTIQVFAEDQAGNQTSVKREIVIL